MKVKLIKGLNNDIKKVRAKKRFGLGFYSSYGGI